MTPKTNKPSSNRQKCQIWRTGACGLNGSQNIPIDMGRVFTAVFDVAVSGAFSREDFVVEV